MTYEAEKQAAITAAARAATLCALVRAEEDKINQVNKEDKSPVTVADFGAQAVVCEHLQTVFPQDVIVAEEDSTQLQELDNHDILNRVIRYTRRFHPDVDSTTLCRWIDAGNGAVSDRYWTLDPIDGTKGFLRKDQYAVALALVEAGQVKVGVLACPALSLKPNQSDPEGVLFWAARGEGAQMRALSGGTPMSIQVTTGLDKKSFRFAESVESAHGNHPWQQAVAEAVGITQPSVRMDSQAKYGIVARGEAALYLRLPSDKHSTYREKIWDHAAGSLIVEEAGGRVTDMYGQPLDFASGVKMTHNQGVVVSNGRIHDTVLEILGRM